MLANSSSSLRLVELSVEDLNALDENSETHTCERPLRVIDAVLKQYETMVSDRRHFHMFLSFRSKSMKQRNELLRF